MAALPDSCVILVAALECEVEDLVGADRAGTVEQHLERNKKNIEHRTQMLIERAKERLAQWEAGTLPARIAAQWTPGTDLTVSMKYRESATCPACGRDGEIEGEDASDTRVRYKRYSDEDYEAVVE